MKMQVICMENHPECAVCFTKYKTFNEEENVGNGVLLSMNKKKEEWFRFLYDSGNCLSHPSILIRCGIYMKLVYESCWERFS